MFVGRRVCIKSSLPKCASGVDFFGKLTRVKPTVHPGSTEDELKLVLNRFACDVRWVLLLLCAGLVVLSAPSGELWRAMVVSSLLIAWALALLVGMRERQPGWVAFGTDAVMIVVVCLSPIWIGLNDGIGWVLAVAGMTSIASQYVWTARPGGGLAIAATAATAYVCSNLLLGHSMTFAILLGLRLFAEGILARCSYWLVRSYARAADRFITRAALRKQQADVARARRRAEREYLATLHDTASATFLMISTGEGKRQDWVADRARHDLDTLGVVPHWEQDQVDLVALLPPVTQQYGLRVELESPDVVRLPEDVARAVVNGLREALSNVARHAGVQDARLSVHTDGSGAVTVVLSDDGCGFDPLEVSGGSFGISGSITRRMREVGGSVRVGSALGAGTTIRWEWQPRDKAVRHIDRPRELKTRPIGRHIRERLLLGMRTALLLISLLVQFCFCLTQMLGYLHIYYQAWPQILAFCLLSGVGLGEGWLLFVRRPRSAWWHWLALGMVVAAAVLGMSMLPMEHYLRTAHWSFGLIGWYGVLLLFERSMRQLVSFFAGCVVLTVAPMLVLTSVSREDVAMLTMLMVSVFGYQLALGLLGQRLQAIVATVEKAASEEERLRTAEVVAEKTHQDHRERYAVLRETTVPLLTNLASGSLDPASSDVRRRCALEAARLRRLIAEDEDQVDPLLHELRCCVDLVQRGGIPVDLVVRGQPQHLDKGVRGAMIEPVIAVLTQVRDHARVTVLRTQEEVRVSVLGDAPATVRIAPYSERVHSTKLVSGEDLWVSARTSAITPSR